MASSEKTTSFKMIHRMAYATHLAALWLLPSSQGWHRKLGSTSSVGSIRRDGGGSGPPFNPSGSLLKAVIMNGAQLLRRVASSPSTPTYMYDNIQGCGRVSLYHSLPLQGVNDLFMEIHDRVIITEGGSHQYNVDVQRRSQNCPFSATLVWADEPGETLINDIDLSLVWRSRSYFPNGRSFPDRHNNAERVLLNTVDDGDRVRVKIDAHNMNLDSIKYSLVVTYCRTPYETKTSKPADEPSPRPTRPTKKPTTKQQLRKRNRRRRRKSNKAK